LSTANEPDLAAMDERRAIKTLVRVGTV